MAAPSRFKDWKSRHCCVPPCLQLCKTCSSCRSPESHGLLKSAGEHSSLLVRPADSRRNPRHRQRGQGSTSLLSTAMRSTSSRQRRQVSENLNRANSVASQSPWPHDADVNPQATRTPASVYGQLTLPQPQFSASPAASTEGNAQVKARSMTITCGRCLMSHAGSV